MKSLIYIHKGGIMIIRNIDLTGNGVALRLHKPVLDDFSYINTKFVRLPDEQELDIQKPTSDIIIIGTPTYKHIQHILYAIKHYPLVLCEKPVGNSYSQILSLKQKIYRANCTCFVNYQLRYLPIVSDMLTYSKENTIELVSVTYRSNARMASQLPAWYLDYRMGGGILYSLLPHIIDLINFLGFGIVDGFEFEYMDNLSQVPMNEITIHGNTASGIPIEISIDTKRNFDQFIIELCGNNKKKKYDFIGNCEVVGNLSKYRNGALSSKSVSPWRLGFRMLISDLLNLDDSSYFATIDDAIKVHHVLHHIISNCICE